LANLVEIWQICAEKVWHDWVEFLQKWETGCYFGNSPDAFTGYGKNLVILTKVGV
jgi:hypothetical protein